MTRSLSSPSMATPRNNQSVSRQPGTGGRQGTPNEATPLLDRANDVGEDGEAVGRAALIGRRLGRWKRERLISLSAGILLLAVIIILLVLSGVYRPGRMNSTTALCATPACIHAASEFLYNLAPNYQELDPCSEFETIVCDGWRSHHDMRPDQGATNALDIMAQNGDSILRHVLESAYPGESNHSTFSPRSLAEATVPIDEQNFNELQRAYNACMAIDEIGRRGVTPLEKVLKDITSTFNDTSSWAETILLLQRHGIDTFSSVYATPDDKDPDTVVVAVMPREAPGLPAKAYYKDEEVLSGYLEAISKVLGAIKSTSDDANTTAKAIVDLEVRIADATPDIEEFSDITRTYNPMSLDDTANLAPELGYDYVFKSLSPSNYTLNRTITAFPEFLQNVSSILSDTPKEAIQGFFMWKAIQNLAGLVEAPEVKPYKQFANVLGGKDADATPERFRTCLSHADNGLGWILSRFFVESAFSEKAKELGDQVISDIRKTFVAKIESIGWMDAAVKKVAADKVQKIVQKVGYPTKSPNILEPQALKDYYAGLDTTDVYFDNAVAQAAFAVGKSWSALGKPTDRDEWGMTASTVNAYYNPPGNEMVFPAGIMQFPLFGGDLPSYINYGGFGAVAGHELSHAFDNHGRFYDADGKYQDWWTNHTVGEFEKRADCFVGEYSNFTVQGANGTLHVNGKNTEGENIADAGGLSAAWAAWQHRRRSSPDQNLPGLDFFTQEQLFYVAYGNAWCSKFKPAMLTQVVLADEHPPDMIRILGTAMYNSRGFREAFKCPEKDPGCELW